MRRCLYGHCLNFSILLWKKNILESVNQLLLMSMSWFLSIRTISEIYSVKKFLEMSYTRSHAPLIALCDRQFKIICIRDWLNVHQYTPRVLWLTLTFLFTSLNYFFPFKLYERHTHVLKIFFLFHRPKINFVH
jgi:hypothetical protein